MKTRLLIGIALVLIMVTVVMAADDPFNGTWRALPSKSDNAQSGLLILAPFTDGISIQESEGRKTNATYGLDTPYVIGSIKVVRIDDHNLASTLSLNGKVGITETGKVSPDGKHYTRSQELMDTGQKEAIEYDRVGSVPAGDAFFGTWQQVFPKPKPSGPLTYTIKIDGDSFYFAGSSNSSYKGKLDGKEQKLPEDGSIMQARRIDTQTIELSFKTTVGIAGTMLWQVKGNTLIRTISITNAQGQSRAVEFERVE